MGYQNNLALGQVNVNEKSNEITAIPELLSSLELESVKDRYHIASITLQTHIVGRVGGE